MSVLDYRLLPWKRIWAWKAHRASPAGQSGRSVGKPFTGRWEWPCWRLYLCCDESYHKVLVEEKNSRGKGVRQGYIWAAVAVKQKLILYLYENTLAGRCFLTSSLEYEGTVQSDAYSPYRKLESDAYPGIKRIACLQHVKRKFLEVQEEPEAQKIVELTNKLYQKEHEHCVGRQGWTDKRYNLYRKRQGGAADT